LCYGVISRTFTQAHVQKRINRESAVSILTKVTGWTIWVRIPVKARCFFSSSKHPYGLWVPPSLLFKGYRKSFPGANQSGREVHQPHLSTAKVKNKATYTFSPSTCLRGVDRENNVSLRRSKQILSRNVSRYDTLISPLNEA
jgi:hypothetical protein